MRVIFIKKPLPKDKAAEILGIESYDTALPQTWINGVVKTLQEKDETLPEDLYHRILFGTVWCYDKSLMGFPFALTDEVYGYIKTYEDSLGVVELNQDQVLNIRK